MIDRDAINAALAVVWLGAALIGAGYTLWCLRDARRDQRAVHRVNGPATEQLALDEVRNEQLRLTAQLVMVIAGLFVVTPMSAEDRATVVRFLLVFIPIILMVKSIRGRASRERIRDYAARLTPKRTDPAS